MFSNPMTHTTMETRSLESTVGPPQLLPFRTLTVFTRQFYVPLMFNPKQLG